MRDDAPLAEFARMAGSMAGGLRTLEEVWFVTAHGYIPADAMFVIALEYDEYGDLVLTHCNLSERND